MNTKIIVALVIGIALIGLTGVASASYYGNWIDTQTEITGTHFTSSSQTKVSGMPMSSQYTQSFQAEMAIPSYTPDFSDTDMNLAGSDYSWSSSIRSSPRRNTVATVIATPSDVRGRMTRRNCALQGQGIEEEVAILPQPIETPTRSFWQGAHPAGSAYPAHSVESHSISWGSWTNWP
jgi:hypothetical protein